MFTYNSSNVEVRQHYHQKRRHFSEPGQKNNLPVILLEHRKTVKAEWIFVVGLSADRKSNLIELFDPETKSTLFIAKLRNRLNATYVRLNELLFCIGGDIGVDELWLTSVECFDLKLKTEIPTLTGKLNIGRCWAAAVVVSETELFLSGGYGQGYDCLNSCELFSRSTNRWSLENADGRHMLEKRVWHALVCLSNKRLFVFGGFGDGHWALNSVETRKLGYSSNGCKWTFLNPMSNVMKNVGTEIHQCCAVECSGKIIVTRLGEVAIFTPPASSTNSGGGEWLLISPMKNRISFQTLLVSQNRLFVFSNQMILLHLDNVDVVEEFCVKEGSEKLLSNAILKADFENFIWSSPSVCLEHFAYVDVAFSVPTNEI